MTLQFLPSVAFLLLFECWYDADVAAAATVIDNIDATELGRRDSLQYACHLLEVVHLSFELLMFGCDIIW